MKVDTTADPADIKRIIRKYYNNSITHNEADNLEKMNQALEKHKLPPTHHMQSRSFEYP